MADAFRPPHRTGARPNPGTGAATKAPVPIDVLAHARECFLSCDDVDPGVVRQPIMASWIRSKSYRVSADHFELPFAPNPDRSEPLTHSARPILTEADGQFSGEPVSLILTDAEGVVLERRTGDSRLSRHLDKVSLAPGFSYAEEFVGTNGIGTALEDRGPAQVFGHEHYVEHLEDLACAGAPIHHPTNGKVLGVVDLTCWRVDASPMMTAAVASIARRIEEALLEHTGRRELALLQDYLTACRRNRGPVLAISNDLVMLNDAAREQIDPRDQVTLLGLATEALSGGKPSQFSCPLPTGVTAKVACKPSWTNGSVIGGVVQVLLAAPVTSSTAEPAARASALPTGPMPGLVGSGALWSSCCQQVEQHFRSGEWLLLEGEPGTGKLALARATHLAHNPGGHLRVFDADDLPGGAGSAGGAGGAVGAGGPELGPDRTQWVNAVREELAGGPGTVILRHVDRLPNEVLDRLAEHLAALARRDSPAPTWVVATRSGTGAVHGALARLVDQFPHSVVVPPLRHHIEDLRALVPFLITRLARGGNLRCSTEAMRLLLRNRWPGNTEQLHRVLRKVVSQRRTGVITPADLPAEVQATSRRVLTPLESIECDAIIGCLRGADGNRAEAARQLGMSRATIYRKIRDYGIAVPPSK